MQVQKDPYKLTSIDEHGDHLKIIPAEVKGYFRKHRSRVYLILLSIFLGTPWLHYQGKQIFLIDIPNREFIFFGLIFKSHDAPMIFLLLAIATLGLAFVVAIWGRLWCGWACPQTVFIDAIYRKIEILVEGHYLERRKLQMAPWSLSKVTKKTIKWSLIISVSILISHSFAAYFVGSYDLLNMMRGPPSENWTYFVMILFLTIVILFDFAWFREQFCVIMCPYGRIQSVLMEPTSLAVVYDQIRGEPRKGLGMSETRQGDCVSCNRCVEVCPTGIDIRNGLQMECIACTACIDACDDIMKKVNKPPGLIAYKTLDGSKFKVLKLKTVVYGFLILLATGVLIYAVKTRQPVEVAVLRGIESPYSQNLDDQGRAQIINHFRLHFISQSKQSATYTIQLSPEDQDAGFSITLAQSNIVLPPKASETWHIFIKAPPQVLAPDGRRKIQLSIKSNNGFLTTREVTFLGPHK